MLARQQSTKAEVEEENGKAPLYISLAKNVFQWSSMEKSGNRRAEIRSIASPVMWKRKYKCESYNPSNAKEV